MKLDRKSLALYAVTDRHWLNGRTLYDVVGESIEGGVTWVQLREKDMDEEEFLKEAIEIKKLCDRYGADASRDSRSLSGRNACNRAVPHGELPFP